MMIKVATKIDNQLDLNSEIVTIAQQLIKEIQGEGELAIKEELQNNTFKSNIALILMACESFYTFLTDNIMTNVRNKKSSDNEYIIKMGTILIFQLRQLITGDSLQFVLAGSTKDGPLKEKIYNQDQIFSLMGIKNFRVSFSNAQIELASCIEKLKTLDDAETSLAEQWKKIIKYGFTSDYSKEESINADEGVYHKLKDINVYMKFVTTQKRKSLSYYYMTNGERPTTREDLKAGKAYDRGWIYQWLKMNQEVYIDENSDAPLFALMTGEQSLREHVPGIKGGDYGSEQYKFRNRRIITLNNIQQILKGGPEYNGIIPSLQLLLQNLNNPTGAFGQLIQDFTTYNGSEIERFVYQRLDELKIQQL